MKLALISATSLIALLAVAGAPAQAYLVTMGADAWRLPDLGGGSLPDGAARTADRQGPGGAADWPGFVMKPPGVARGTAPDEDFATQDSGAWRWNAWQKALAIGIARVAPLIGTIGSDGRPGSSVFVAAVRTRFGAAPRPGPGSTNTMTMTLAPGATEPRLGFTDAAGSAPAVHQPEAAPAAPEHPAPVYRYAPQPGPDNNRNLVAASFAAGQVAAEWIYQPLTAAKTGHSPFESRAWRGLLHAATGFAKQVDVGRKIAGGMGANEADGSRRFISPSVSVAPELTAATYVASAIAAAALIGQPPGGDLPAEAPADSAIEAGTGPLGNPLALP